jgi:hypothetical protein
VLVRERTYVKENYADTYPTRVWVSWVTDEVLHSEPLLRRY